jgi:shikimate kinase
VTATVALIGISGAGKSRVGRALAARLDAPLVDVDAEVERLAGRTIADIFTTEGEPAFRARERDVCVDALARPGVVSLGGGAPMTPAVADALRGGVHVVWLRVSPEVAASRVDGDLQRPLIGGHDALAKLQRMLHERGAVYAGLATQVVDADSGDLDAKVDAIVASLKPEASA